MTSIKVSIKPHNQKYLQILAEQMQVYSYSEIVNYLLLDLQKMGYSFGSPLPNLQQQRLGFKATLEPQLLLPESELPREVQEQIDPVIERLVTLGVVDQF
jgi:hypothetical protein